MSKSHGRFASASGVPSDPEKTALMDLLCKTMRERYDIAATPTTSTPMGCGISGALGVADAGSHRRRRDRRMPHTAIREDASMNSCRGRRHEREFASS